MAVAGPPLPTPVTRYVLDLLERAGKTAAQAALTVLTLDHVVHLVSADWLAVGDAAAIGAITSILTSLASQPVGSTTTASLVN